MNNHICTTCGVQYAETSSTPEQCPICLDERQYVKSSGQSWTTLAELEQNHRNVLQEVEHRIYSGWWDKVILEDGKHAVERSAARYIKQFNKVAAQ